MFVLLKDSQNTLKPMCDILEKSLLRISQGSECGDIFQVRWTNLQSSGVTFLLDSVYQKLLKSVHVWQSYSKNKKLAVFWDTVYKRPMATVL